MVKKPREPLPCAARMKGKMKPPIIYLGGPINGCTDEEVHGWRDSFMTRLPRCGFLDPMMRDYRGRELECCSEIVNLDEEDIDNSDVFLGYCWQPSWGTGMEIHYAYERQCGNGIGLPLIVLVVPVGNSISPWLVYHSDVTLEEAAAWIEERFT